MEKNKNESISIIGGAGFLGTRLSKLLKNDHINHNIYDLNDKVTSNQVIKVDIENLDSLSAIKDHNSIVNLAALHRDDIRPITRYDEVNIKGSENVCNAARKYGINKIVFTSSVAIYGFAKPDTGEDGQPNYFNDYGRTKYLAEQIYKDWQEEDKENRTLVIVRPTVIFGEGNRGNVYNLLKQIASKKFIMIGSGCNKKSMAYVENVAAFLKYSLSFNPGIHVYNYIDKPDMDMNTLVSKVRHKLFNKNNVGIRLPAIFGFLLGYIADSISFVSRKNLPISSIRIKKFLGTTQFSSSINHTGFIPPVTLEEGLERTIYYEFIEDNSDKLTFDTE